MPRRQRSHVKFERFNESFNPFDEVSIPQLLNLKVKAVCVLFHAGESGLVYKAYINTALGKELVAVKTGKGIRYNHN